MSRNAHISRLLLGLLWVHLTGAVNALDPTSILSTTEPAAERARIVVVEDSQATITFAPQLPAIETLVNQGIKAFTGDNNSISAWRSLVTPKDIVGIKVHSQPGEIIGTRKAVVQAVAKSLIEAGIPSQQIIVWDKYKSHLRLAGFYDLEKQLGIKVEASAAAGWDPDVFYENALIGKPIWGDLEFGRKGKEVGRKSYFSKLVTRRITRHILISPLLNDNVAGVTGNLMSLALGSVDNTIRFESRSTPMAKAVPEIFGQTQLYDRLALVIVDSLICQYQGGEHNRLHYARVLNQLRFSSDPVAQDVLSLHELEAQRVKAGIPVRRHPRDLVINAALLELGIASPRHILIEHPEANTANPLDLILRTAAERN